MTFLTSRTEEAAAAFKRAQICVSSARTDEAENLCRAALELDHEQADALKLLIMILSERGADLEVEKLLSQYLVSHPKHGPSLQGLGQLKARQGDDESAVDYFHRAAESLPSHAPLFNDLGVSLYRLGRPVEAIDSFDRALQLEPGHDLAHSNRGMALLDCKKYDEAMHALLMALINTGPAPNEERASILQNLVKSAYRAGKLALIEPVLREEAKNDASAGAAEQLAFLLDLSERHEEAKAVRNQRARRIGLSWSRAKNSKATVLILGGVGGNHVPTRYLIDPKTFSSFSLSLLSADEPNAPLGFVDFNVLRRADVVFNALGDADIDEGQLAAVRDVCQKLGKPLLNPPEAILQTGRENAPKLFKDIPSMIVPMAHRTTRDELAARCVDAPVLVRPIGDHGGERLMLLRDDQEKTAYVSRRGAEQILLTPFYDFRSADEHWRKYRLIFVDRHVYAYHLAIGDDWLVHYWRAGMARAEWKKREEEEFLTDWRAVFGPAAASAVEAAARRLNLDYCGMDCALMRDGRVLLFEANACMLLHLNEPVAAFPYKHRYVPKIRDAFSELVLARAGNRN